MLIGEIGAKAKSLLRVLGGGQMRTVLVTRRVSTHRKFPHREIFVIKIGVPPVSKMKKPTNYMNYQQ